MCVACRKMREKNALIKVVMNKSGEFSIDYKGNKDGRGAYVCKDSACIEQCLKKKGLNRAFKCNVGDEVYKEMRDKFSNGE